MKSDAVQMFAKSYPPSSRVGNLYQLQHFLDLNKLGPEEILELDDEELKACVRRAVLAKNAEGHYASGRRMFYVVRRFLELNGRELGFNRTQKKALLKRRPKKISRQYVPTREDIYRMVDAVADKGSRQQARARALILCLWQSGVRASCLCGWTYGIFKNQLWPTIKVPVEIKVVGYRPEGVVNCAQDTKLSSYNVGYYYTFLHEEAANALKTYLEERMKDGWQPEPEDFVFVTEGTVAKGDQLNAQHLVGIVKRAAEQIGIDPNSIWTHCLRKAFRKTLYRGGVDSDVAEALMGHKLPGSRGSYFDYHDVKFAANEYMRGFWSRIKVDRIRNLEDEIGELRKEREKRKQLESKYAELKQRLNGLTKDKGAIDKTMTQLVEDSEFQKFLEKKIREMSKD
jgi:integrase